MPISIFYHQIKPGVDCPDGIASAWVAKKVFPDAVVYGATYDQSLEDLPELAAGDTAVLVDFSFPVSILEILEKKGVRLTIVDHHKGKLEEYKKYFSGTQKLEKFIGKSKLGSKYIFDNSECGATLTWKYFFKTPVPAFLEIVRDRDLWIKALEHTEELHRGLAKLRPYGIAAFKFFDEIESLSMAQLVDKLYPIGKPLVEERNLKISKIIAKRGLKQIELNGIRGILIKLLESDENYTSDIAEKIYSENVCCFVLLELSDGSYSLRSKKDCQISVDVSEIAKSYGGGGHKHAAGFRSNTAPYRVLGKLEAQNI